MGGGGRGCVWIIYLSHSTGFAKATEYVAEVRFLTKAWMRFWLKGRRPCGLLFRNGSHGLNILGPRTSHFFLASLKMRTIIPAFLTSRAVVRMK